MESREQRIATLTATLKASGIAKSDSQARMMAEEMIGVEEHVQKSYEVEHAKAHEYLQTAKNLGTRPAQQTQKPVQEVRFSQPGSQDTRTPKIQELPQREKIESVYTDVNINSTKPLAQAVNEHDTHNPAIEAIKSQMMQEHIIPLEDREQPLPKESSKDLPSEVDYHDSTDSSVENSTIQPVVNTLVEQNETVEQPTLDTQKLVEMMEEDGKLEEHTREIKEKPKDVKPKEAYAENSIDLGDVFNFNKK